MSKDQLRNWLNIIFMLTAVVGVVLYLQKSEHTHLIGLYTIFGAMAIKIIESSMRMIK